MFGNLGLHVIKNPAGTYHFVGRVPSVLAYRASPELLAIAAQAGPGIAKGIAAKRGEEFKTLVWATEADARDAAQSAGFTVGV